MSIYSYIKINVKYYWAYTMFYNQKIKKTDNYEKSMQILSKKLKALI